MNEFNIQGKGFNDKVKLTADDLSKAGIGNSADVNKLHTLFDEFGIDVDLSDGIDAKEAKAILGLFDSDGNSNIAKDEMSRDNLLITVTDGVGSKSARDNQLMNSLQALVSAIGEKFMGSGTQGGTTELATEGDFTTLNGDGNINGGHKLETNGGKTTKIRYNADGSKVNTLSETWEDGYQNYRKEWNGPNGERSILEGIKSVDNGDGTFSVTVKRIDPRFPEETFTLVLDSNGNEISRCDDKGNQYDSSGALIQGEGSQNQCQTVTVDAWGKGKNDCLSRIITNAYPNVKYGTKEYFEIEKLVMDANPEIYGDENGNGGRKRIIDSSRHNAVIHAGDTINLPVWNGTSASTTTSSAPKTESAPVKDGGGKTAPAPVEGTTPAPVEPEEPAPVEPEEPVEPAEPDPVDSTPPAEPLKKVGMYWQKVVTTGGVTTTYLYYDEAGTRLRSKTTEDSITKAKREEYYNEAGKMTSSRSTDPDGTVHSYEYDTSGRVTKNTTTAKDGTVTESSFNYSGGKKTETKTIKTSKGSTVSVYVDDKKTTESKYNTNGLILSKTEYMADGKTAASDTTYSYNKNGNLDKEVKVTYNDKCGNTPCKSTLTTTYRYMDGKHISSLRTMDYAVSGLVSAGKEWTEVLDANGKVVKWSSSISWVGQNLGPWNKPSGIHQ